MATYDGHIYLIIGPMFAGKSTELIRLVKRYQIAKHECIVIKYEKDTRYGNKNNVYTHDSTSISAISTSSLCNVMELVKYANVIGIDEGQFFPNIATFCENMANEGKIIIVAALDGTFQRKPFENILKLIPLSEKVTKLNAVCMDCYTDASYSKRLGTESVIEVIGGKDKYKSVCRKCFFKK
ncbi:recombinant pox virus thymidine kinase [Myxoma virus]|uniref:Thymidine kinase n=2 Tax=Myxoma virus TaxID=10273 RepID=A0A4P8ETJ8_9POXV|nr:recombinant pox virus thymidine kinase [Myxoma virus]QDP38473.1 ha-m061 [Myxoma virus]QIJ55596.1 recombinant pox virus thymidine kinase [Myxoma virus]QIJ55603.1 recombinant pox virus thymidine kinase [Myxoma virus]QIJ55610.1 recombinant pox virus thymidine kinase [Myxoma virus]